MSYYYTTQGSYNCTLQDNIIEGFADSPLDPIKQKECIKNIMDNNDNYKVIIENLTNKRNELKKKVNDIKLCSGTYKDNYSNIDTIYEKTINDLKNDYTNLDLNTTNLISKLPSDSRNKKSSKFPFNTPSIVFPINTPSNTPSIVLPIKPIILEIDNQKTCVESIIENNFYYKDIINTLTNNRNKLNEEINESESCGTIIKDNYSNIDKKYEETIKNLNIDYANLETNLKSAQQIAQQSCDDRIKEINSNCETNLKSAQQSCDVRIKEINSNYETNLKSAQQSCDARIKEINSVFDTNYQTQKDMYESKIKEQMDITNKTIQQFLKEKNNWTNKCNNEKSKLDNEILNEKKKLEKIKTQFEKKLSELQSAITEISLDIKKI